MGSGMGSMTIGPGRGRGLGAAFGSTTGVGTFAVGAAGPIFTGGLGFRGRLGFGSVSDSSFTGLSGSTFGAGRGAGSMTGSGLGGGV